MTATLAKLLAALVASMLTLAAPPAHHKGETVEIQCISHRVHHHHWAWMCEAR